MKHKFPASKINVLLDETHIRVLEMKKLHKDYQYIFKIEEINVSETWPVFYDAMKQKTLTVVPNIQLEEKELATLAFYLDFIALFFKYNALVADQDGNGNAAGSYNIETGVKDGAYCNLVDQFFIEQNELAGPRSSEILFQKVFR